MAASTQPFGNAHLLKVLYLDKFLPMVIKDIFAVDNGYQLFYNDLRLV